MMSQPKKMEKGEMGLADGKNAHVMDVASLLGRKHHKKPLHIAGSKLIFFPQFCRWILSIIGVNPLLTLTKILMC